MLLSRHLTLKSTRFFVFIVSFKITLSKVLAELSLRIQPPLIAPGRFGIWHVVAGASKRRLYSQAIAELKARQTGLG